MKPEIRSFRLPIRYLAALLALPGIVGMGRPTAASGQFSVSPVILPIPHSAEASEATVMVRNNGESPLQLRVFSADFDQSLDGSHSTFSAGTHDRSCADRLEIVPDGLSVPAGVTQPVTIRLRPGTDPEATCWSLVFIEKPPPEGSGPRAGLRIGVKVYGLSAEGGVAAEITEASIRDHEGAAGPRALEFTVNNPDAWPVLARGTVELREFDGGPKATVAVESFSVLPEHERTISVPLETDLEPGRYLAIPVLEYGDDGLMGAQVAFRVE
jgi:hypothetical protein